MGLTAGLRLGVYEIQEPIGAGGMGEVYRARDRRLGRDVAIKVLPASFTADSQRLARFEREARILAALNHPHIATIHGIEESTGIAAIVLELVEGETLAERIAAHSSDMHGLPMDEALRIARQIAEALEAAHDKGIVHRDLKPANIRIAPDGTVKVLDFGLAKSLKLATDDMDGTALSTTAMGATEEGLVVGTVAYMSPEQARGRPVDKRTDIWAYGCVLFEMLSGQKPFAGETSSDLIAAILEREPAWNLVPPGTPRPVRHLLHRCLEKDSRRRLRDIGEARVGLTDLQERPAEDEPVPRRPGITRRAAINGLIGAAAGVAVTSVIGARRQAPATVRSAARFAIAVPEGGRLTSSHLPRIAISPDGTVVAANVVLPGTGQILVRRLRDLELRPPAEGVISGQPFFSPDSQWLGYLMAADGQWLRKVALSGGAPATICAYGDSMAGGATWGVDDMMYFVSTTPGGISRVPAAGGEPTEIVTIDFERGERLHRWPHALPGGQGVLFTLATEDAESYDDALIAVYSLATGERRVLVEGGTAPKYSPSGHLVYARAGKLLAVPFDPVRLQATGRPFTALDGVMMSRNNGVANFDISAAGDLVYVPGQADGGARHLVWVDRSGNPERVPLPARSYLRPRLSPDGRRLAIEIEGSNHNVYVYDFATGVLSNITTDGVSHWPVWSPDGTRIGYRSGPMGQFQIFQVPADRSRPAERIPADGVWQSLESFSPDGRLVVYATGRAPAKLVVTSVDGQVTPQPLENTKYTQGSAKVSPDGRCLAYCSNESGRPEVYVRAFPRPGPKVQVSNDGGTDPVWRRSGTEVFYRNGNRMMAVPVSTTPTFSAARPQELWRGPYSHGMSTSCGAPGITSSNYDVTPDGQRFLMIQDDDGAAPSSTQFVVVQGWADDLARLARA